MPITEWVDGPELPGRPWERRPSRVPGRKPGRPPVYGYLPRGDRVEVDPWKLRRARYAAGLRQADLAALVYIRTGTLGCYERGLSCPPVTTFRRLFTALGCGPEDLLPEGTRYGTPQRHGRAYDDGAGVTLAGDEDE
jgi:hypothetical protein